jgi:RNA polymerase sigma-70 factor (ECF subfamily)
MAEHLFSATPLALGRLSRTHIVWSADNRVTAAATNEEQHDCGHRMRVSAAGLPVRADDAAIIEASCAEPDAFAGLFDRHAPLILRYISRRVGPSSADDLVAETFLAAFRRRQQYDTAHRDARPWLYGIATHLISQHRREESRQLRIRLAAGSVPEPADPGHGDRVAASVTANAVRGVLTAALAGLPAAERDVLVLIAWEQLSYDEVARALDVPVGTVRSRLSRARGRVREALASTGLSATFKEILSNE